VAGEQALRPRDWEAEPAGLAPPPLPPQRRGFAETFETFVARGVCDSPSAAAQAQAAGEANGAQEAASLPASDDGVANGSSADFLSPNLRSGGGRATAEPASGGGSVLGSTCAPEGEFSVSGPEQQGRHCLHAIPHHTSSGLNSEKDARHEACRAAHSPATSSCII